MDGNFSGSSKKADLDVLLATAYLMKDNKPRSSDELALFRENMTNLTEEISQIHKSEISLPRIGNIIATMQNICEVADEIMPWQRKDIVISISDIAYTYSGYKTEVQGRRAVVLLNEIINNEKFLVEDRKSAVESLEYLAVTLNSMGNAVGKLAFEFLVAHLNRQQRLEIAKECAKSVEQIIKTKIYHIPAVTRMITDVMKKEKYVTWRKEILFELVETMIESQLRNSKTIYGTSSLAQLTVYLLEIDENEFEDVEEILDKKIRLVDSYRQGIKLFMDDEHVLIDIAIIIGQALSKKYKYENVPKRCLELLCDLIYAATTHQTFDKIKSEIIECIKSSPMRQKFVVDYLQKLEQTGLEPYIASKNSTLNILYEISNLEGMRRIAITNMEKRNKTQNPRLEIPKVRLN